MARCFPLALSIAFTSSPFCNVGLCTNQYFLFWYAINRQLNILSFFLMSLVTTRFFLFRIKKKWLKNGWAKVSVSLAFSSELSLSSWKYKSDIVFLVLLSPDQNLMKLLIKNNHNIYLINSLKDNRSVYIA